MKSLNLKEKIDYITSILSKYNQTNQTNLKIIIKGSAILSTKNLIDREPNDIDICFVNNENLLSFGVTSKIKIFLSPYVRST